LDKTDRLREADDARMRRLQELAQKQTLSNAESQEAAQIIEALESHYGDLGPAIDSTTGRILGAAEAQERLTAAMQKQAEADIRAEIFEHQRNIRRLGEAMDEVAQSWMTIWAKESETSKLHRQQQAELSKIDTLMRRLAALREGNKGAAFGDVPTAPVAGVPDLAASLGQQAAELESPHKERMRQIAEEKAAELARIRTTYGEDERLEREAAARRKFADKRSAETADFDEKLAALSDSGPESAMARAKALSDYETQLAQRLEDLRISQIEDEEARELARIEAKYAKEREEAERLGADLVALREAQEIEAAAVRERFDAQRAERRKTAEGQIRDEIARNTILRDKTGLERELALIRLDEEQAIRDAGELGIPVEQIQQQFALRRQLAAQSYQAPEIATRAEGTFSAEAAQAFGTGSSAVDRIAKEGWAYLCERTPETGWTRGGGRLGRGGVIRDEAAGGDGHGGLAWRRRGRDVPGCGMPECAPGAIPSRCRPAGHGSRSIRPAAGPVRP
jgi:hypothetical protein